ncbi:MAG: wax ester/triacylglycerol synthase family O-acyltransferase [Actinobacteria bacterium]|nr:wax ester/triacylglycerol synthase family O-acyltransferase [Actinomycetota bacterium]MCA1722338.1 wax ester/triacylglycerol synthase family O-acyltransferase [Actinomycetota bacterium]
MQQLSGLDAAFLAMETSAVFGHVGSVCVIDPSTAPEPLTLDRLTTLIENRLHLIPPFRRRLVEVPLGLDQPYWIEDPGFDVEYHVRELALPEPGDDRQLAEQAARLHARPLDRRRPLWELYLIHGLQGGRKAIYTKVHHAAIDGVSGNDILAAVLDLSPDGRDEGDIPEWTCDKQPGNVSMLARSAVSLTSHPVRAARVSYGLVRSLPGLAASPGRPKLPIVDRLLKRDANVVLSSAGLRAPATPFNKSVSPHRRWAFISLPLDDVKQVKNVLGTTVNDVVMALSAGALRRWLLDHDALPEAPLVAGVPVSVRTEDQKGTGGNRVSSMIAPIPTNLADARERLQACHEAMQAAKAQHGALPADMLADVAQFAMPALAGQAARLAARLRLVERINAFNLIISNVPGPNIPLYYAGCRLEAYYPLSAIADGQGLNITVMSYGGQLHFGLIADRQLVPDLDKMAGYLADELAELKKAVA